MSKTEWIDGFLESLDQESVDYLRAKLTADRPESVTQEQADYIRGEISRFEEAKENARKAGVSFCGFDLVDLKEYLCDQRICMCSGCWEHRAKVQETLESFGVPESEQCLDAIHRNTELAKIYGQVYATGKLTFNQSHAIKKDHHVDIIDHLASNAGESEEQLWARIAKLNVNFAEFKEAFINAVTERNKDIYPRRKSLTKERE